MTHDTDTDTDRPVIPPIDAIQIRTGQTKTGQPYDYLRLWIACVPFRADMMPSEERLCRHLAEATGVAIADQRQTETDGRGRRILPRRRPSENHKVSLPDGTTIYLTVGYHPDGKHGAAPCEVFYSAGFKSGSQLEFQIQDACVLISLLLQVGVPASALTKSLSRVESPATGALKYASTTGIIAQFLADLEQSQTSDTPTTP